MRKHKIKGSTAIIIGTLLAIPLMVAGFLLTSQVFTRASDSAPQDVVVSQITDRSAVISWSSSQETQGVIEYGTTPTQLVFFAPETVQTEVHRVELTLLSPDTTYYFQIRIGNDVFDDGGVPWSFATKTKGDGVEEATPEADLDDPFDGDAADPDNPGDFDNTSTDQLTPTEAIPDQVDPSDDLQDDPIDSDDNNEEPLPTTVPTTEPTRVPRSSPTPIGSNCPIDTGDCSDILEYLGTLCTSQDYLSCLNEGSSDVRYSYAPTYTPAPTPAAALVPPADVSASAISSSSVQVEWDPDSVESADGFRVFRAVEVDGSPGTFGNERQVDDNDGSYIFTSLEAETKYYFYVLSFDEIAGNDERVSTPSAIVNATTPAQ